MLCPLKLNSTRQPSLVQFLSLTVNALARMRQRGTGPAFYRVGGGRLRSRIGYRKNGVETWLAGRRVLRSSEQARQCANSFARD